MLEHDNWDVHWERYADAAFDRHIGHRQHFTRDSITRTLQAAGFTVERVCLSGFPFLMFIVAL